jgi:hypothetical protein
MKSGFKLPPFCVVKSEQSMTIKFIVRLTETSTRSSDFNVNRSAATTEMHESSYTIPPRYQEGSCGVVDSIQWELILSK